MSAKARFCKECTDKLTCKRCNNRINENEEIEAKSIQLKTQPPNRFGHMLPYPKE